MRESSLDDVAPFDVSLASATRTDFCDAGSAGAASGDVVDARPACTSDATAKALNVVVVVVKTIRTLCSVCFVLHIYVPVNIVSRAFADTGDLSKAFRCANDEKSRRLVLLATRWQQTSV